MSFGEDARALEQSFFTTRELLQQLLKQLEQRRAAWISVRPSVLAPSNEIERLSQALAHEEDHRAALLGRLRAALPTPLGVAKSDQHVNVTRIAAALPSERGRALRAAADAVQPLAKRVRAEVTLGQRLLQFSQRAQQSLFAGMRNQTPDKASGYDRQARTLQQGGRAGQLVDGRM